MAIVINGNGTISGISVGGLPDGTVDAGTLATNSVDSAELIDGAVDDSHMAAMAASKLTGTVATANIADNAITLAKMASGTDGNIISFDASGNPVAIATGSDGQVLTSTGAGSPPAFETAAAGGKVLQVVYITGGTGVTYNSSTTEVSADLSGAITPSSTSSKIIIIGRLELTKSTGGNDAGISLSLRRGSSGISNARAGWTNSSIYQQNQITHTFLDSPSTTNATTYSYFWGSQLAGTNSNIARERNMILMEIAG